MIEVWNDIFSNIWNNLLSITVAAAAVIALFQAGWQTKLSNKQHLFDRRLRAYNISASLLQLYESNEALLDEKDVENEPPLALDYVFVHLTNCTYLEHISGSLSSTLEQKQQREFLIKLEDIRSLSNEIEFIFNSKSASCLSDFVMNYQKLLNSMYRWQVLYIHHIKPYNETVVGAINAEHPNGRTLEEICEKLNEPNYRKELTNAICKLRESHEIITQKSVMSAIEDETRLTRNRKMLCVRHNRAKGNR